VGFGARTNRQLSELVARVVSLDDVPGDTGESGGGRNKTRQRIDKKNVILDYGRIPARILARYYVDDLLSPGKASFMTYAHNVGLSASEDRLEKLIAERISPGANKADIDARIWDLFGEEWAVMFTDLAGFSRGVASFGIIHFLQIIYESQRLLIPCIDQHDGILLKLEGDSMLVIFRNSAKAIDCALDMQAACTKYSDDREESEQVRLCVGLGYGRMLRIGDRDVYGSEVNAAAKLGEDIAGAGEILVTDTVRSRALPKHSFEGIERVPPGAQAAFRLVR
jgi:adenylate cyclase